MECKKDFEEVDKKSIAAYTLGLIGSTLSMVICIMNGIVFFFIGKFANVFIDTVPKVVDEDIFVIDNVIDSFQKSINYITNIVGVYWFITVIGFLLGIIGTITCWVKNSVLASSIMIIGGVFSITSLLFPGVFLLIGGVLNLRKYVKYIKSKKYS